MRPADRRRSASLVLFAIAFTVINAGAVRAAEVRNEAASSLVSLDVVKLAVGGDVDAAFARAAELGLANDAVLSASLEAQKQSVDRTREALGAVSSISTPMEFVFAGCITRSFLVRHARGKQLWTLKWRRGADGWYLQDLAVRGS